MAVKRFKLDKNELYITCYRPCKLPNGKFSGLIGVYKLLRPQKHNMLTNMDWSFEPEIIDPMATNGYNSLEINGYPIDYNKLVQALCISRLRVNRLGYCYFRLREGVADTMETYGFTFYRMNDMWNWSEYGMYVDPTLDKPAARMNWDRHDILHGGKLSPFPADFNEIRSSSELKQEHEKEILMWKDQMKKLRAELETYKSKNSDQQQVTTKEKQRLTDQMTKLQAELDYSKSRQKRKESELKSVKFSRKKKEMKNLSLKDKVKKLEANLNKEKENQRLKDQVKMLETELEKYTGNKKCGLVKKPVASTLFVIKKIPGNTPAIVHWGWYFEYIQTGEEVLTPTNKPVSDGKIAAAYKALVFRMEDGVVFDAENWCYIGVKEIKDPILIYEGSALTVEVVGFQVFAPMRGTDALSCNCDADNVPGQRGLYFGLTILAGYGPRLAIKLHYK